MPRMCMQRRDMMKLVGLVATASLVAPRVEGAASTSEGLRIRKLSWAGILIETANSALFIDVVAPNPAKGESADLLATTKEPNAIVTHNHGDHFSNETVSKVLGKNGLLVCQRSTADWIDQRGLRVQPVDLWQPVFFPRYGDDLVAFAVPAVDGWGVPQASWVIDGGEVRIFHAGDTQWHGRFADIGRAYGPFDAVFLPINGARQQDGRFTDLGNPAVLTPLQAVAAAELLGAKLVIPIHYGGADPPSYVEVADPVGELKRAAEQQKIPIRILQAGDSIQVRRESAT